MINTLKYAFVLTDFYSVAVTVMIAGRDREIVSADVRGLPPDEAATEAATGEEMVVT